MHAVSTANSERSDVVVRIAYDDLRGWIDQARRLGEINDVSDLTWEQDIGMVCEITLHDDSAACFIFNDVLKVTGKRAMVIGDGLYIS